MRAFLRNPSGKRANLFDPRVAKVRGWVALICAAGLISPPGLSAQTVPGQEVAPAAIPMTQSLKIIVLAGQQGQNDLEHHVMSPLAFQVLDQNDFPVEGADVVLRFPLAGASASFDRQQSAHTFKTDATGQARATGWQANNQFGNFQVQVTATYRTQMGQATVSMSNVSKIVERKDKGRHWWSSRTGKIVIIAVVAGGVVAGVLLATRGGSSGTTVTISPGAPTLGAPR
jgi:hypothetical protein